MSNVHGWSDSDWADWYEAEVEPHTDDSGELLPDGVPYSDEVVDALGDIGDILDYTLAGDLLPATAFAEHFSHIERLSFHNSWRRHQGQIPSEELENVDIERLGPDRKTVQRGLAIAGALGAVAVLIAIWFLSSSGETDVSESEPAAGTGTATQETETPSEEPADDSSSEVAEDPGCSIGEECDAEETPELLALTAYFDCPEGFQLDLIGRLLSGKEGEQREPDAETEMDQAGNNTCNRYRVHSHEFTMIVEGDGESLSKEDHTSYQVFFIVNNEWPDNEFYDDTGFMVLVQWNHLAKQYTGRVTDSGFTPIKDASIDIEWLDVSTIQVIVDLPGDEVEVTEVRTEVVVYISDANDNYVYDSRDIAIWTADQ